MKTRFISILSAGLLAVALSSPLAGAFAQEPAGRSASPCMISTDTCPGWTGHVFVRGSHSSIASDALATRWAQTGPHGGE